MEVMTIQNSGDSACSFLAINRLRGLLFLDSIFTLHSLTLQLGHQTFLVIFSVVMTVGHMLIMKKLMAERLLISKMVI